MKFKQFRFKKVKSTNNTAIRIIKSSNFKYGMVISDTQTKGRGQYGKKWISYKGNIFVSFFHELKNINLSIPQLTKINCLLVKKLLTIYYKKNIILKQRAILKKISHLDRFFLKYISIYVIVFHNPLNIISCFSKFN